MPKKIRELKRALERAGFVCRSGKGSHTVWSHPALSDSWTMAGADGDDAKPYQEKAVRVFLQKLEQGK